MSYIEGFRIEGFRIQPTGGDMPFDTKRMIVGGFKPIVQAGSVK